jgi:hypothetical protein
VTAPTIGPARHASLFALGGLTIFVLAASVSRCKRHRRDRVLVNGDGYGRLPIFNKNGSDFGIRFPIS